MLVDGGIMMGYFSGVINGLNDVNDFIYMKGILEIVFWGSNVGVKIIWLEVYFEMGSIEILEKEILGNFSNGISSNVEVVKRLVKCFYYLDRFKRLDVVKYFGKNNEFSKLVVEEYLKFFDFIGMMLD